MWSIPTGGSNVLSDEFSFARQVTRPLAPKAIDPETIYGDGFIALWQATSASDGFSLEVSESMDFGASDTDTIEVNGLDYFVSGLRPETEYHYRVRARSSTIFSDYSDPIITVKTVLPVPVLLSPEVNFSGGFTINWEGIDGIDGYDIEISDNVNFNTS